MRWLTVLLIALFGVLSTPHAVAEPIDEPTQPQLPGLGIRLLQIPEALQDDPRARIYIIDNVAPGTTITRAIEVQNRTGRDQPVDVYPGAAFIEEEGGFGVEDGAAVNDLTSWMKTDLNKIDMTDGEIATVDLTIDVPRDAPEGEQYAVLWAQVTSAGPAGTGTILVNRVGIRVYLSVGPGNGPKPDFTIDSLTPRRNDAGSHEVVAEVSNTGGRALDLGGEVILTEGPGGLSLGPKPATGTTVAPGRNAQVVFALDTVLQPGPWQATVTLKSGNLTRTVTGTLTFPDSGSGESVDTTTPQAPGTSWTWYIVGATFALLLALVALLAYRLFKRSPVSNGHKR